MRAWHVRWRSAVSVLMTVFGWACVDEDPVAGRAELESAAVAGVAAAALGPDGRFTLAAEKSANGDAIISPAQARRLAQAFLRTFGSTFLPGWVEDRGGPIDLASLTASPRVFFAQTPYQPLPRNDLHAAHRRIA